MATAKAAEQAPAASSSSGTAAQPTDKKRATCRRLAAACLSLSTSLPRSETTQTFERSVQKTAPAERSSEHRKPHTQQQQQRNTADF